MRASSRQATALAATTSSWNTHAGPPLVTHTKTGISTMELAMRFQAGEMAPAPGTVTRAASVSATSHLSKASRPALELGDGAIEIDGPEIGPESRGHPELRVGDLPQEKVRDPHLAARADQEIGIGDVGGVERLADLLFRDLLGLELPRHDLARQRPERVDQLVPRSVVERHQHGQPGVVACFVYDVVDAASHAGRQSVGPAEHAESSVASHQLGQLRVDRPLEQAHEHRDLVGRAAPVLGRERVEGQVAEAQRRGGANDRASRLHALVVSGHARQAAMGRPASVAVHDDGDMLGNRLGANGLEQVAFRQNDRISCSFFFSSSSTLAMKRSVVFWIWSWLRRSSSSETFLSLASAFSRSFASRRRLRTATRDSSAILCTVFASCLRRSSVGDGIARRTILPSLTGVSPRSDVMIAFSIALS